LDGWVQCHDSFSENLNLAISGIIFFDLHGKESLAKANAKLGSRQLAGNRGDFSIF
jgi:hypothetical protein